MLRMSSLAVSIAVALRPVGYLVRDLAPWLIRGAVAWLIDHLRRGGSGRDSAGEPPLCRTCPFQPRGAPVPADPCRPAVSRPIARKRPSIIPPAVLLPVVLAMLAAGCAPHASYIAADRATFEALAPEYADYVAADETLDASQKDRRRRTVESWRVRLEKAETATRP